MSSGAPAGLSCVRWVLEPSVCREDVPGLCEQFRAWLRDSDNAVSVCDVSAVTDPDAVTIEVLARLQLSAQCLGRRVRIEGAGPRLTELLTVTGLADLLSGTGLRSQPGRQRE